MRRALFGFSTAALLAALSGLVHASPSPADDPNLPPAAPSGREVPQPAPPGDLPPPPPLPGSGPAVTPPPGPEVPPLAAVPPLATKPSRHARPAAAKKWLFLGGGINIGFFSPKDVNRYIEGWVDELSGTTVVESGFTSMILHFGGHLRLTFKPIEYLRIHLVGELAWGPKAISSNQDSKFFSFLRISPGLEVTGHIPFGSGRRHSIFAGGGALYHWMKFEHFQAGNIGGRAMVGYSIYIRRSMMTALIAFDYARADTGKTIGIGSDRNRDMSLDYTGVLVSFSFQYGII